MKMIINTPLIKKRFATKLKLIIIIKLMVQFNNFIRWCPSRLHIDISPACKQAFYWDVTQMNWGRSERGRACSHD